MDIGTLLLELAILFGIYKAAKHARAMHLKKNRVQFWVDIAGILFLLFCFVTLIPAVQKYI